MKRAALRNIMAIFLTTILAFPAVPAHAGELAGETQLVQYRGDRGSCRGLRGWERDRCERGDRRHDPRRKDKDDLKAGIAAGVIGLAIGAIIAGAAKDAEQKRNARQDWIARCSARFRTFDARTGTYVGNDGRLYRCR